MSLIMSVCMQTSFGHILCICRGALQACALTRSWHGRGTRRRVPRLKYNSIPQHLLSAPPRTEPGARVVRSRGLFFGHLPVVDACRWAPLARRALFSCQTFQAQMSCDAHAEISVQFFGAGIGLAGNNNEASGLLIEQALSPINSQQNACCAKTDGQLGLVARMGQHSFLLCCSSNRYMHRHVSCKNAATISLQHYSGVGRCRWLRQPLLERAALALGLGRPRLSHLRS